MTGRRQLARLQRNWNEFGRRDPYWAILTDPDKRSGKWDVEDFFATGRQEVDGVLAWVASLDVRVQMGTALDFGCGVGRLTQALASRFQSVLGVDIAPSMLALAEEHNRHGERCRYVLSTTSDLHVIPDSTIDFVYSRLVLQHVPPPLIGSYISEFIRVLRAGGAAVFNVPAAPLDAPIAGTFKTALPAALVRVLRRLKRAATYSTTFPHMEIHGLSRDAVERLVNDCGGLVVEAIPDSTHGEAGPGFLYCVLRAAASEL